MSTTRTPSAAPLAPQKPGRALGLPQATALIVGSIIGVGIFNLPGSLASYGPISIWAMVLTTVGALALALMFASMSRRLPADGGPYAYARTAFGNGTGFANAWSYWITAWAGNAAIVVGWVFYVQYVIGGWLDAQGLDTGWLGTTVPILGQDLAVWPVLFAVVGLWLPAGVNLLGVKNMGAVQLWTSVIKFVPLALMSTVGLFAISTDNFSPMNLSGDSDAQAILGAMALCLFSYLGVETASVAAAKVRNPDVNVPRSTIFGTLATAAVYLLSLIAVFGSVPSTVLGESSAPYSTAADAMTGGTWAGWVVAACVIISGFGALNGWTMICAEMPLAAANDGLFPTRFGRMSARGVPAFGIIASTVLATVAVVFANWGSSGYTVFNTLVYMSGITAAIPYIFSGLAQLKWRITDSRKVHTPRLVRDLVVAVVAIVFSVLFIVYSRNTGDENTLIQEYAPFIMAGAAFVIGIPVYLSQRKRMTEPEPVPDYPTTRTEVAS
ncbi:APC family permease [Longivirga aurantiaca]|uniref:APC family permease n=1 Tax=Longivirga aurantiaca TaxID=1837743 RepID=A0ABW1T367_9ACTN